MTFSQFIQLREAGTQGMINASGARGMNITAATGLAGTTNSQGKSPAKGLPQMKASPFSPARFNKSLSPNEMKPGISGGLPMVPKPFEGFKPKSGPLLPAPQHPGATIPGFRPNNQQPSQQK